MFAKIVTGFFWDTYDNLGKILLVNLLWFTINIPGFLVIFGLLGTHTPISILWVILIIPIILMSVTTMGMYHFTYLLVEQKDIKLIELFHGMKKYGARGVLYAFSYLVFLLVLLVNIRFYLNITGGIRMGGAILAGLAFWIILFLLLVLQYLFPLLVRQNIPFKKLVLRSFLLVLDNLWITLLVSSSSLGLIILTTLTGVGPMLFTTALVTLFGNNALYEILAKYDKKPEPLLKPGEKPTSWHQILPKEQSKWRHENRGWKDILRPWDM